MLGYVVWGVLCLGLGLTSGAQSGQRSQWVELVGSIGFAMIVWAVGVVLYWLIEPVL